MEGQLATKTEGEHCWCDKEWHQPIEYDWNPHTGYDCPVCESLIKIDDLERTMKKMRYQNLFSKDFIKYLWGKEKMPHE